MTDFFKIPYRYGAGGRYQKKKKKKIHMGGNQTQEGDAIYSKQNICNRQKMRGIVRMMLKGISHDVNCVAGIEEGQSPLQ